MATMMPANPTTNFAIPPPKTVFFIQFFHHPLCSPNENPLCISHNWMISIPEQFWPTSALYRLWMLYLGCFGLLMPAQSAFLPVALQNMACWLDHLQKVRYSSFWCFASKICSTKSNYPLPSPWHHSSQPEEAPVPSPFCTREHCSSSSFVQCQKSTFKAKILPWRSLCFENCHSHIMVRMCAEASCLWTLSSSQHHQNRPSIHQSITKEGVQRYEGNTLVDLALQQVDILS